MKTATSAPEENDGAVMRLLAASPVKTGHQVGLLVTVLNELGGFLASAREGFKAPDEAETKARDSAASTYELANLQLRNILDDQQRWQAFDHSDKAKQMATKAENDISNSRLATIQNMGRPHLMMNAKVQFFPEHGNKWIAWVGELKTGMLHGSGDTPQQALTAFDLVYLHGFPQQATPKKTKKKK